MKNPKIRVVHRSLLQEAVDKEKDTSFLKQVLEALKEKEKTEESKVKRVFKWMASKLCCGKAGETGELLVANDEKETKKKGLTKGLQKLEEAAIDFSKEFGAETGESLHQEVSKKIDDIREQIIDLQNEIVGEEKRAAPLWDSPNDQGDTALHLSVKLKNPEATSLLLEYEVDPNVQDRSGRTPLHLACDQADIEQATKLVRHKVLAIDVNLRLFVCLI